MPNKPRNDTTPSYVRLGFNCPIALSDWLQSHMLSLRESGRPFVSVSDVLRESLETYRIVIDLKNRAHLRKDADDAE